MVAQISAGKADRVSHSSIPFASEMLISGCRWGRRCADVAVKKKKKKQALKNEKKSYCDGESWTHLFVIRKKVVRR
jgi:hypothetical protein